MNAPRAYDFKNHHFVGEGGVLIPLLQKVQAEDGYISRERIEEIHRKSGMPLAHIYGVATFYAQFRLHPVGGNILQVCHGTACHVASAVGDSRPARSTSRVRDGETTADREFSIETVSCLGCCSLAPAIMINKDTFGNLSPPTSGACSGRTGRGRRSGPCGSSWGCARAGSRRAPRPPTPRSWPGREARRRLQGGEHRLRRHVLPGAAGRDPRRRRDALAVRAHQPGQGRPAGRRARRQGRAGRGLAGVDERRQGPDTAYLSAPAPHRPPQLRATSTRSRSTSTSRPAGTWPCRRCSNGRTPTASST